MSEARNVTPLHEWGVECLSRRTIDKGSLVAFCDLAVARWGVVLRDCKWFRKEGREWIGLPSSRFTGRDGKTSYTNLIEFADRAQKERFDKEALPQIKNFRE